jgi:probable rRNA maturation factor
LESRDSGLSVEARGRAARLRGAVRREVARRLGRAMQAAGQRGAELALSFTDDDELRELNRVYAGEDHATDVLSFSQREGGGDPKGPLGDVIISVETARRQAVAGRRRLTDELFHLAVHGLCHLLGYDHATPAEERVMFGYEARLRAAALGRGAVGRVPAPPPTARPSRRASPSRRRAGRPA